MLRVGLISVIGVAFLAVLPGSAGAHTPHPGNAEWRDCVADPLIPDAVIQSGSVSANGKVRTRSSACNKVTVVVCYDVKYKNNDGTETKWRNAVKDKGNFTYGHYNNGCAPFQAANEVGHSWNINQNQQGQRFECSDFRWMRLRTSMWFETSNGSTKSVMHRDDKFITMIC